MARDSCMRLLLLSWACCLVGFLIDLVVSMVEEAVVGDVDIEGFGWALGCINFGKEICGVACDHQCCIGMR